MDNSFENLKTGFSFGRVVKVTEFHGKYEITYKMADGSTLYITFDENDIVTDKTKPQNQLIN